MAKSSCYIILFANNKISPRVFVHYISFVFTLLFVYYANLVGIILLIWLHIYFIFFGHTSIFLNEKIQPKKTQQIVLTLLAIVGFFIKKISLTPYEKNSSNLVFNFDTSYLNYFFDISTLHLLLFLCATTFLIFNRKYLHSGFVFASFVGWFLLLCFYRSQYNNNIFYFAHLSQPLILFLSLPFIDCVYNKLKTKQLFFVVSIILMSGLSLIIDTASSERRVINHLRYLIKYASTQNINSATIYHQITQTDYHLPYRSLLLSTALYSKPISLFFYKQPHYKNQINQTPPNNKFIQLSQPLLWQDIPSFRLANIRKGTATINEDSLICLLNNKAHIFDTTLQEGIEYMLQLKISAEKKYQGRKLNLEISNNSNPNDKQMKEIILSDQTKKHFIQHKFAKQYDMIRYYIRNPSNKKVCFNLWQINFGTR